MLIMVLPFTEGPEEWIIQGVPDKLSTVFVKSALLDPALPLIHSLWDDLEITRFKEKRSDGFRHISPLLLFFSLHEFFNLLRIVALINQELLEDFNVITHLVSFEDYVTLGVNNVC